MPGGAEDEPGVEVHVGVEVARDEVVVLQRDLLQAQRDVEQRVVHPRLLQQLVARLLEDLRARVEVLVDPVAEPHEPVRGVTSGPGATNSVTPIRDCMADSVPVVLICGQVPRAAIGTDAFQEAPVFNIMSACAKKTFLVLDPEELEATVRTAFEIARSDRPGPVVIDVPKDVQNWVGTYKGAGMLPLRGYRERMQELYSSRMPEFKGKAFFDILAKSERPLLYVGGGVIKGDAARELRQFATTFNIPVVTTLQAIGSFDTTHNLSLHMLGMHGTAYANYAIEDCDFLIAVGARFDDRVTGKIAEFVPHAKIAHLDVDATEIGKVKQVTWSHVADARTGLQDLLSRRPGL